MLGYVAVAVGGAAGAAVRYGLSGWVQALTGGGFPFGTLLVNIIGSLIIGVVLQLGLDRFVISLEARLLWTTGFCGGLTTFSTFSFETLELMRDQQWAGAGGNVLLNVVLCLLATYLGMTAAKIV